MEITHLLLRKIVLNGEKKLLQIMKKGFIEWVKSLGLDSGVWQDLNLSYDKLCDLQNTRLSTCIFVQFKLRHPR